MRGITGVTALLGAEQDDDMKMGGNKKGSSAQHGGRRRGMETRKDRLIIGVKFVTLARMGTRFKLGVEVSNVLIKSSMSGLNPAPARAPSPPLRH